jgi:hypothetical protein
MHVSCLIRRTLTLCSIGVLTCCLDFSAVIFDTGFTSLTPADPSQQGRLLRDGVPSDWTGFKPFPGTFANATTFRYEALAVPISPYPFLQISVDDPNGAIFAAGYFNSYHPDPLARNLGLDVNYLGDAGSSGNPFGNPSAFQIFIPNPSANHLVVVVTGLVPSISSPFRILVEGFYDPQYNDTTPVPEPASAGLGAAALAVFFVWLKRRSHRRANTSRDHGISHA